MESFEFLSPPENIPPSVTNKPKKKDGDMKIDKTTYKERKETQIGMTADYTSRPDKVLFFADTQFLFFKNRPTLHTLSSRTFRHTNQSLPKSTTLLTLQILHQ